MIKTVSLIFMVFLLISCASHKPTEPDDIDVKEVKQYNYSSTNKEPTREVVGDVTVLETKYGTLGDMTQNHEYWYNMPDYYGYIGPNKLNKNPSKTIKYTHENILGVEVLAVPKTARQPEVILGELAGSMEYWLAREVMRRFKTQFKEGKEELVYEADPFLTRDIFTFGYYPAKKKEEFIYALKTDKTLNELGITDKQIKSIIYNCRRTNGWNGFTLRRPEDMYDTFGRFYDRANPSYIEMKFLEKCLAFHQFVPGYTHLNSSSRFKLPRSGEFNPQWIAQYMSINSPFEKGYHWNMVDKGLLEHAKGKYGTQVQDALKNAAFENKRVTVILTSGRQQLKNSEWAKSLYLYSSKTIPQWTGFILDSMVKPKNSNSSHALLFNEFFSMRHAMEGKNILYPGRLNTYNNFPLNGDICNFDNQKIGIAYQTISMFELNCVHQVPYLRNEFIKGLKEASIYNKNPYDTVRDSQVLSARRNDPSLYAGFTSHVRMITLQEKDKVKSTSSVHHEKTAFIEYTLTPDKKNMQFYHTSNTTQGKKLREEMRGWGIIPSDVNIFALTMRDKYPPSAIIVWRSGFQGYYALQNGVLYQFKSMHNLFYKP
jgi:hypothetical protein